MAVKQETLTELLKAASEYGASDIHIREGEAPCFRIHGDLIPIKSPPVKKSDLQSICSFIFENSDDIKNFDQMTELDGAKTFEGVCRVRFNFFKFQNRAGLVLRLIKTEVKSFKDLHLTSSLKKIALQKRGLILLTGATGSGKSTTMAAMIQYINTHRNGHILTIEDPVEYLYSQDQCRITQREVRVDTPDFHVALKSALRQDPDVICIGEMRDKETVDIALKAAETGHLVLSTIHTSNAINTIGRIIAMFPPEAQRDARTRLADNLYSTISQRMLKRSDQEGVIPAQEIMITSPGIKDCINEKEDMKNFYTYIREGFGRGGSGSQTFDQHLKSLVKSRIISKEVAMEAASSSSDFAKTFDFT